MESETSRTQRSTTAAEMLLPASLVGKSFLGFGCVELCIAAANRGASPVGCVVADNGMEAAARSLADAGRKVALLAQSAPDLEGGAWDWVVCDGTLSRARDPLFRLDRLIAVTRETLVIATPRLGWRAVLNGGPLILPLLRRIPAIIVGRSKSNAKSDATRFYFSESGLSHILTRHRTMFADVEWKTVGDTSYTIASKRRIGRLILVSGPVSSGKTTFINALLNGKLPEISETLGISPNTPPPVLGTSVGASAERVSTELPVAISHYGFLRPYLRPAAVNERDEALDVLTTAREVSIVTLAPPSAELVARITGGEIDVNTKGKAGKAAKRHLALRAEYSDERRLATLYGRWFRVTEKLAASHHLVIDTPKGPSLIAYSDWKAEQSEPGPEPAPWPQDESDATRRDAFASQSLPVDLTGMSVLDVECGTGAICREALRRGASRVVGIDASEDRIAVATQVVSGATFLVGTLESLPDLGKFDTVVCFGRFSHERAPLAFIDRLTAAARHRVAFGFAGYDSESRARSGLPMVAGVILSRIPLLLTRRRGIAANNRGQPKFLASAVAMSHILNRHRRVFSKIRIEAPLGNGISAAIADKIYIRHLIVVAAPLAAGESTICRKLIAGELDEVYDRLGVTGPDRPKDVYRPCASGGELLGGDVVLFQFDFPGTRRGIDRAHQDDENLDVLKAADRVSVLTVCSESERPNEEHGEPALSGFQYGAWLRFAGQVATDNWVIVEDSGAQKLIDAEQWWRLSENPREFRA